MRELHEHHRIREMLATTIVWLIALTVSAGFCWIMFDILTHGLHYISWSFLVDSPTDAGRAGGIGPIIVSTILVIVVCMLVALPLGIGTAVLLAEYTNDQNRFGRFIRSSLDVLAAVPSIVFGLFGSALFCVYMGMGFSIVSGGLTLACMVLPIFIRIAEQGFRDIPNEYRHGAAALGISRCSTLLRVLMPTAMPSLITGFVLGIGRAIAETAALIFTSGYVDRMPESLMDSGRVMSVHIYDLAMNVPGGNNNAYATAVVLIAVLLVINAVASYLARYWARRGMTKI